MYVVTGEKEGRECEERGDGLGEGEVAFGGCSSEQTNEDGGENI